MALLYTCQLHMSCHSSILDSYSDGYGYYCRRLGSARRLKDELSIEACPLWDWRHHDPLSSVHRPPMRNDSNAPIGFCQLAVSKSVEFSFHCLPGAILLHCRTMTGGAIAKTSHHDCAPPSPPYYHLSSKRPKNRAYSHHCQDELHRFMFTNDESD
jgi:hypothetical protein